MLQGPFAFTVFIVFSISVLIFMIYGVFTIFSGAYNTTNAIIDRKLRAHITILKDYGTLGSVTIGSHLSQSQSVGLVKCSDQGEVFYILLMKIWPFSAVSKITLDLAEKLSGDLQDGAIPADEGDRSNADLTSMPGFPGKIIKNYGKIGATAGLLKLDNNGKVYYLFTTVSALGGPLVTRISLEIAGKLVAAFQDKG